MNLVEDTIKDIMSKNDKDNLSTRAYEILKKQILTLALKPGDMLTEVELSEKLGISRTPIRSALQRLVMDSFVESIPKQGNFVAKLTVDSFVEVYQIREVLELLSIKLAALNWVDDEIDRLKKIVDKQNELSGDMNLDTVDYLILDMEFHKTLSSISHNKLLYDEIVKVNELYYRYNYYATYKSRAKLTVSEHYKLIEAIELRDIAASERMMKEHLAGVKENILLGLLKFNN